MTGLCESGDAIADAAMDLIAEILEVEEPELMHTHLVRRCQAQPERMAQLLMCLAIWSSAATTGAMRDATQQVLIQRARARLMSVGDEAEYMRLVQDADRANGKARAS